MESPWVQLAVLCEDASQPDDAGLTITNLGDWANLAPGTRTVRTTLLVRLQATEPGTHDVAWRVTNEAGKTLEGASLSVDINEVGVGTLVTFGIQLGGSDPGQYWFDVLVDGQVRSRVPMRVVSYVPESGQAH